MPILGRWARRTLHGALWFAWMGALFFPWTRLSKWLTWGYQLSLVTTAAIVLAVIVTRSRGARLVRLLLGAHATIVGIVVIGLMRCLFVPRWAGPPLAALCFAVVAWVVVRRPTPMAGFLATVLIDVFAAASYLELHAVSFPSLAQSVVQQAGVTSWPIVSGSGSDGTGPTEVNVRYVQPLCEFDDLIVGSRSDPRGGAFHVDRRTWAATQLPVRLAGDHMIVDCERDLVAIPDYVGGVFVASPKQLAQGRYLALAPEHHAYVATWDPARRQLYVMDEDGVFLIDVATLTIASKRHFAEEFGERPRWMSFDTVADELIVDLDGTLVFTDPRMQATRLALPVARSPWGMHVLDEPRRRIFRPAPVSGMLEEIDLRSHSITRARRLGFGIEYAAYDPARDELWVSNYARGVLMRLDAGDWTLRRQLYVGHRSRFLAYDAADPGFVVATTAGVFHLRP